jgi:hypothetical protein
VTTTIGIGRSAHAAGPRSRCGGSAAASAGPRSPGRSRSAVKSGHRRCRSTVGPDVVDQRGDDGAVGQDDDLERKVIAPRLPVAGQAPGFLLGRAEVQGEPVSGADQARGRGPGSHRTTRPEDVAWAWMTERGVGITEAHGRAVSGRSPGPFLWEVTWPYTMSWISTDRSFPVPAACGPAASQLPWSPPWLLSPACSSAGAYSASRCSPRAGRAIWGTHPPPSTLGWPPRARCCARGCCICCCWKCPGPLPSYLDHCPRGHHRGGCAVHAAGTDCQQGIHGRHQPGNRRGRDLAVVRCGAKRDTQWAGRWAGTRPAVPVMPLPSGTAAGKP